jgi:gamma-glutamyltranspeptidase / glutathione hydrolase
VTFHYQFPKRQKTMRAFVTMSLVVGSLSFADTPFRGGAVAAAHPVGSAAGKEMLDKGGNAVDAAVASAFAMAVVGPYHSGLGGGGFAIIHDVAKGDAAFDFRETAPAKASRDMFIREGKAVPALSTDGALAVAVPGAILGYIELQAKYGKLPRAVVLGPAIRAAQNGFVVTPKYRALATQREGCLNNSTEAKTIFLRPNPDNPLGPSIAPPLGTLLKQPQLAKTLLTLAQSGAAPAYTGRIAEAMVATVAANGGLLEKEDLARYATHWRAPLEGRYRGHRMVTMPPPSAGGLALLQVLSFLEANTSDGTAGRSSQSLHLFIEALRRSYVDRAKFLGDPDFVNIPVDELLSPAHLADWKKSISPTKATPSLDLLAAPAPAVDKHTTHISVIDSQGNAVALTTTVNYYFGSCLVAKGTGILLNDQMDDFAAQPMTPNNYGLVTGEANAVAGKKIPLSSMTPTLVFSKEDDRAVMLAVGSPGGSTIPTTVLQVVSHVIDGKLDIVRAVGQGRIHHQYLPDVVTVDKVGLDPDTAASLEKRGHVLKRVDGWGDAEAVFVDPETKLRTAGSDPRNEGAPSGQP